VSEWTKRWISGNNLELLPGRAHSAHNLEGKENMALRRQIMFQKERRLCRQAIKTNVGDSSVSP
jgi:hypothetical protein